MRKRPAPGQKSSLNLNRVRWMVRRQAVAWELGHSLRPTEARIYLHVLSAVPQLPVSCLLPLKCHHCPHVSFIQNDINTQFASLSLEFSCLCESPMYTYSYLIFPVNLFLSQKVGEKVLLFFLAPAPTGNLLWGRWIWISSVRIKTNSQEIKKVLHFRQENSRVHMLKNINQGDPQEAEQQQSWMLQRTNYSKMEAEISNAHIR